MSTKSLYINYFCAFYSVCVFAHNVFIRIYIEFFVKYDQLKGLRLAPCYGRMQMHTKNVKERRHSDEKETYDTDGC